MRCSLAGGRFLEDSDKSIVEHIRVQMKRVGLQSVGALLIRLHGQLMFGTFSDSTLDRALRTVRLSCPPLCATTDLRSTPRGPVDGCFEKITKLAGPYLRQENSSPSQHRRGFNNSVHRGVRAANVVTPLCAVNGVGVITHDWRLSRKGIRRSTGGMFLTEQAPWGAPSSVPHTHKIALRPPLKSSF